MKQRNHQAKQSDTLEEDATKLEDIATAAGKGTTSFVTLNEKDTKTPS